MREDLSSVNLSTNKNTESTDLSSNLPNPDYYGSTNIAYEAVGAERTELWTGGGLEDVVDGFVKSGAPSIYPLNQVSKSEAGHIQEVDDTPDNQRMIWRHANRKTGIELRPDGGILISTPKGRVEVTGEDYTVLVEGDGKLVYKGNLDINVTGDLNIDCMNMNVNVRGNKKEDIAGSHRKNVTSNVGYIIGGGYSTTTVGQTTNVHLGGYSHNVKGTFSNNVDGIANFFSSSYTTLTSETIVNIASEEVDVTGNTVNVQGGSGTIGGKNTLLYAKGADFSEGVTAPTFHGDLDGTATTSTVTQSQTYAENSQGSAGSITNTATPTINEMTTAQISAFLEPDNNETGGITEVKIDPGDFIKNYIDKSSKTDGITTKEVTTAEARKRFRNTTNRSNSTFVSRGIENGSVCLSYNEPTPPGIGRITAFESPKDASGLRTKNIGYKPVRKTTLQIIPEQKYNPRSNTPITSKTKLAEGISIAKFLSGEDGGTNWDFIKSESKQISIANYYYMHAQIMKTIANDSDEFKDYRLVVSEGLYRKGPSETIVKGSIADYLSTGRAVVYNLIDSYGNSAIDKLFDLAVHWKDIIFYDKMILDYDTIDCNRDLSARLIIILPELDEDFSAEYNRNIETHFNGTKLSNGELVEVLPFAPAEFVQPHEGAHPTKNDPYPHQRMNQNLNTPDIGYDNKSNGKFDPATLVRISGAIPGVTYGSGPLLLTREYAAKWNAMKAAARKDGIELVAVAAYRSYTYQKLAYKNHKAVNPNYTIAQPGRSNHGLGQAVDIQNCWYGSDIWNWLNQNGARYGFEQDERLAKKDPVHWSKTGR